MYRILNKALVFVFLILLAGYIPAYSQLRMGNSRSQINFRETPSLNSGVQFKIDNSNLLVILPDEPVNGFVYAFDIESSSFGYVYESLIMVTDTLYFRKQNYFERSEASGTGDVYIRLINRTGHSLFLWINKIIYSIAPYEMKDLVLVKEDIIYFASEPGFYPVFGREVLKKGFRYIWNFTL